jgi:hypothetical protein
MLEIINLESNCGLWNYAPNRCIVPCIDVHKLIEILDLNGNKILVIFLAIMNYWNLWIYILNKDIGKLNLVDKDISIEDWEFSV